MSLISDVARGQDELVERHKGLVESVISHYGGGDKLRKAGERGLLEAIHFYEGENDFDLFALWFIRKEVESELPFYRKLFLLPIRHVREFVGA